VRADLIKKHGAEWAKPGKIATLGPFLLEEWKAGERIVLTRNIRYFNASLFPAGMPERAEAVIQDDDEKARALFEGGKLDFLLDATTGDLLKARSNPSPGMRVDQFPYLATYYLGFQVNAPPLNDMKVRKALALAVDRDAIPAALQGGQIAAMGWLPPGIDGHGAGISLRGSLYDARGLLMQAGFAEGARFPKLTLWVEKFDGAEKLSEFLVKSFRDRLGVELEGKVAAPSDYQAALKEGRAPLFVGHWGADYPEASNFLEVFTSASRTNSTFWKSGDYDKHLANAVSSPTDSVRRAHYVEAEKVLLEKDVAILPLFYRRNTVLIGSRLNEFRISPLNYLFLKALTLK
jgi:oligopeptide transport system substrate-binding protein